MSRATTMIVDDNEGMRLIARALVEEVGGTVVAEAADGDEAVTRAMACRPRVILMDQRMPRSDGVEATARIKALHPGATVVAWTSVDDAQVVRRFFEAGAAAFVAKHDISHLERVLRRLCS